MNQLANAISDSEPYYLKSVTEFGESNEVVNSEDIYSQTGLKLISKGTRINKSFHERLIKHKLAILPIDRCLTVRNAVTPPSLARDAVQMLDGEAQLTRMAHALPDERLLRHALAQIYLNSTLAFKLTMAREQRPALYQHSLRIALISLYLGACVRLKREEMIELATAAVFHDLGELHIDPALLDPAHKLDAQERQHIYAHPMIAHLILKEYPEYRTVISPAVLEHHERLDGSGYPRNLKGASISPLGQILAVAELAGSLCGTTGQGNACEQVEVILKLNSSQFRGDLVKHFSALINPGRVPNAPEAGVESGVDLVRIRTRLENIAKILVSWNQTYASCQEAQPPEYLAYTCERVASLEKNLRCVGFNPAEPGSLAHNIEEDPRSLTELDLLVRESGWQMKDILYEIRRRWPEIEIEPELATEPAALALRDWVSQAEPLL
jgi:hypothetical protein